MMNRIYLQPKCLLRPNKKDKCVLGNGSEYLGRLGIHVYFGSGKNIISCILKGLSKCTKLYFFPKNLKIYSRLHQKI